MAICPESLEKYFELIGRDVYGEEACYIYNFDHFNAKIVLFWEIQEKVVNFISFYLKSSIFASNNNKMTTKVFVSHASADRQIVSLFVDEIMIAGMGFRPDEVFYSSKEEMGVENGNDIPESIRQGLVNCQAFIMMVSDNYRHSEVCLNEMGAAWIRDDLLRIILLLPGAGVDRIGWLLSLKKATYLTDSVGLDRIHDQISERFNLSRQTPTWNYHKGVFLSGIAKMSLSTISAQEHEEDEPSLLDDRDCFDENTTEYIRVLKVLSEAITEYNAQVGTMTKRLDRINENPKNLSTQQIRGILHEGAVNTNNLAGVIETNTPILQERFTKAMEAGIRINQCDIIDEAVKSNNRQQCGVLIDAMLDAKNKICYFKESLEKIANLDKDFKRSKKRLICALNGLLAALNSCVSKAKDYQVL